MKEYGSVIILVKTVGILLAGGKSSRFGKPKALAVYHDKFFFEYALEALHHHVHSTFIVSHPSITEQLHSYTSIQILEDIPEYKGNGPLAGMFTVMKQVSADWFIVLPCDTPNITENIISKILIFTEDTFDAVIPVIAGRTQPLVAAYHSRVLQKIEAKLNEGKYSLKDLLESCHVKYVTEHDLHVKGNEFQNINNQEEYRSLKDL